MSDKLRIVHRRGPNWLRLLLIIPFIATLWVPFYNHGTPAFFGLPFFYWYQMLWVPLAAIVIFIVYRSES